MWPFNKSKADEVIVPPQPEVAVPAAKPKRTSREIQDAQKRQRSLYDQIEQIRSELKGLNIWLEENA